MGRYLAAAFLFRVPVAGLGAVPLNVLAFVVFAILGLALPPLWLLGAGLEIAYLFGLATNPRFQRLVDARDATAAAPDPVWERTLVERLPAEARARVAALDDKIGRTLSLYGETDAEPFVAETNRGALERLRSSYVELLRAQQTLRSLEDARRAEMRIRGQVDALEREIADPDLSPPARDAKAATLGALRSQLEHLERREGSLREIDSYLAQIEAQVDLTLEAAASKGRQEAISAEIDVASFSLDALRSDTFPPEPAPDATPRPGRVPERR
jgi:hypothetical protein